MTFRHDVINADNGTDDCAVGTLLENLGGGLSREI
jgi:hypothetical protein